MDPNSMTIMRDFMQSSGTWYFKEDGDLNIAENPVIEEGCRIYKELMNSGVIKLTTGWGCRFYRERMLDCTDHHRTGRSVRTLGSDKDATLKY